MTPLSPAYARTSLVFLLLGPALSATGLTLASFDIASADGHPNYALIEHDHDRLAAVITILSLGAVSLLGTVLALALAARRSPMLATIGAVLGLAGAASLTSSGLTDLGYVAMYAGTASPDLDKVGVAYMSLLDAQPVTALMMGYPLAMVLLAFGVRRSGAPRWAAVAVGLGALLPVAAVAEIGWLAWLPAAATVAGGWAALRAGADG